MTKFLFLESYKKQVENSITSFIQSYDKNKLRDACEYVLTTPGKRLRPIIALLVNEAIAKKFDVSYSALAVELFHTASLIADDLPCMDDEKERRCKPALHIVFGESAALLASYTLISSAYEMITKNGNELVRKKMLTKTKANNLLAKAIEEVSKVAGFWGATNGQFLDLFPPDNSFNTIIKIIEQKTVSLFQISFILGWLFGGGEVRKLEQVKKCAYHFGMAFQIADDIIDIKQDTSNLNALNIAISLGRDKALDLFSNELKLFNKKLKELKLNSSSFEQICFLLKESVK